MDPVLLVKTIDAKTLFFAGALVAGTFTPVMLATMYTRKTYPGYGKWAICELCCSALFFLQAIRGTLGDLAPVIFGNALTCAASILLVCGMYEFVERKMNPAPVYALSIAFLSGVGYFYFYQNDIRARTMLLSAYLAATHLYAAWPLLGRAPRHRMLGFRFAAAVLAMGTLNGLVHLADAIILGDRNTLYSARATYMVFYVGELMVLIGITFSFFILTNERASAELLDANTALATEVNERLKAETALRSEVGERKRLEVELKELAKTDELTGVLNRRGFLDAMEREVQRAYRFAHRLSVLMVDLDYFKKINDTYGHEAGDRALRQVAEACSEILRTVDIVGRLGGDEFAVILPETNIDEASLVGEKLRIAISQTEVRFGRESLLLSVSIGVAGWNQTDKTGDAAIAEADGALYRAKHDGRNCVRVEHNRATSL
jgi:diguanylate cyclase (GGDEF)-like protein